MELSNEQQEAFDAVKSWTKDKDRQVFRLFGYAGTGKTTIAKEFANTVGGTVLYAAYTGKAVTVLQSKGCAPCTTIHRLIYQPKDKSTERLEELEEELLELEREEPRDERAIQECKAELDIENQKAKQPSFALNPESELHEADLLVVDEVSMVGKRMGADLLSFGKKVLVLGDPAQLQPVGESGFFTKTKPDFLLTEIHRQAAGSPILKLATMARQGQTLDPVEFGDSRVVPKGVLKLEDVSSYDQIIVGTNKARRDINRQVRSHFGRNGLLPVAGDRLVCLRNNYQRGLLNGGQWSVLYVDVIDNDRIHLDIQGDGITQSVVAWRHHFEGRERDLRPWDVSLHEAFDFGYALTCHKAQGSQWNNVLVIDESKVFRGEAKNWLYTAITRAAQSVTVVKKK